MPEDIGTTDRLHAVVVKLNSFTNKFRCVDPFAVEDTTHDLVVSSYLHFASLFSENSVSNFNDAGKLFAIVDFYLRGSCACLVEADEKEDEPSDGCIENYSGQVRRYTFMTHSLEVSLLAEKPDRLHISVGFSDKRELYKVVELVSTKLKIFEGNTEEADKQVLTFVHLELKSIFSEYIRPMLMKKNPKHEEYSLAAIKPMFSYQMKDTCWPVKKKQKTDCSPSGSQKKTLRASPPAFYTKLSTLYKNLAVKPTSTAKLFAFIYEILYSMEFRTDLTYDTHWPGTKIVEGKPVPYDGDAFVVWIHLCGNVESDKPPVAWNVSVLANDQEFYVCIRGLLKTDSLRIKKINKELVPTFDDTEIIDEMERIHNLDLWLCSIILDFIYPEMRKKDTEKTYTPIHRDSSGTSDQSQCPSVS